jgi:hypothetical protein
MLHGISAWLVKTIIEPLLLLQTGTNYANSNSFTAATRVLQKHSRSKRFWNGV